MASLALQDGRYAAADTLLGTRTHRRIGHNTTLRRDGPGRIAVRYWSTDIYTVTDDGWAIISTGGWDTVTTWSRVNGLLPGPWAVWSERGRRSLYAHGHAVTPYVDRLAVNVGTTSAGGSGAVGMSDVDGTVAVLLTAGDVATIEGTALLESEHRSERRAARLLREHPAAGGPRTHNPRAYDRRARDCARCDVEERAEHDARRARLSFEHDAATANGPDDPAAGSHVQRDTVTAWPVDPTTGRTDYHAPATHTPRVRIVCPWECPQRAGGY